MKQHINFYQPLFYLQKNPLTAWRLLAVVGAVSGALLLTYVLLGFHVGRLEGELAGSRADQAKLVAVLTDLQGKMAPKEKSELLEREIARLASERDARLPLVKILAADMTEKTGGVSSYLEALGRPGMKGLWLRRIGIGGDGRHLVIEGSATSPELVPRYLRSLARQGSFAGLEFDKFNISRSEESSRVDFRLETHYFEGEHEGS